MDSLHWSLLRRNGTRSCVGFWNTELLLETVRPERASGQGPRGSALPLRCGLDLFEEGAGLLRLAGISGLGGELFQEGDRFSVFAGVQEVDRAVVAVGEAVVVESGADLIEPPLQGLAPFGRLRLGEERFETRCRFRELSLFDQIVLDRIPL